MRKIISKQKTKAITVPAKKREVTPILVRYKCNSILEQQPDYCWESKAAFSPGAIYEDEKPMLFIPAKPR